MQRRLYRYRCSQCRTTSPAVSRSAVAVERARHRRVAHAGHIPDGERITVSTPRPRPGTPTRPEHYAAYLVLVLVLVLVAWVRLGL